tara:strand:- start:1448 stop:1936 length:489 start_codon:yes stop_codon:yes gene_type:complete
VYKIITKVINKYKFNSKLFSQKEIKKTVKDATIEDKEEYFVIAAIKIQEIQKKIPSFNDKAKIIPRYVAIPFPPLNFIQTGNICPRKAIRPDKKIKFGKKCFVIKIGITPFAISKNKVMPAINLFPVLKTLVAPIFLEPISLISLFKNSLVKTKPKGIEPDI